MKLDPQTVILHQGKVYFSLTHIYATTLQVEANVCCLHTTLKQLTGN